MTSLLRRQTIFKVVFDFKACDVSIAYRGDPLKKDSICICKQPMHVFDKGGMTHSQGSIFLELA